MRNQVEWQLGDAVTADWPQPFRHSRFVKVNGIRVLNFRNTSQISAATSMSRLLASKEKARQTTGGLFVVPFYREANK
ncbi:hypothetical protein C9I92_21550 [Photobacterium ganghwense]|uniref:Uncharacterized protein n=1 Tax=Photobacterium ganghwense TaxID=320778 RepID=A0A0J1HEV4_9GAMM|nr:hypothetical protein ABT57_06010 [Photobacterium ganghwense]PSU05382.1 hypothetical protein C9I92_21550 [Photobacterium ganghwense]